MNEIQFIKGFEGLYFASRDGRIFKCEDGRPGKEIGISRTTARHNYTQTVLYKDGKDYPFQVHRLIAETFIPNPDNLPYVNHKDGNKHNNHVDNLEWVTASQNSRHAIKTGLYNAPKVAPGREMFSFLKGYNQVPVARANEVRDKILSALGLKTRVSWYQRLYGNVEPKISEARAVESVFAEYGIKEVWGAE